MLYWGHDDLDGDLDAIKLKISFFKVKTIQGVFGVGEKGGLDF
jgi:hypothetical protein